MDSYRLHVHGNIYDMLEDSLTFFQALIAYFSFCLQFQYKLILVISSSMQNSASTVEFQNNDILLQSLKSGLFGYIVQKLRFYIYIYIYIYIKKEDNVILLRKTS